jgi:hypothetical protein
MKEQEPMYSTVDLVYLFAELLRDGYTALNIKLITDLIERDCSDITQEEEGECQCHSSI